MCYLELRETKCILACARAHVCARVYIHLYILTLQAKNLTRMMPVLERDIVAAILRLLRKTPECFAWKEHGGMYGTAGIPDIIACYHGQFIAFEVKVPGGKLTKLQELTIQKINDAKGYAYKVTSAADVAAILQQLEADFYA